MSRRTALPALFLAAVSAASAGAGPGPDRLKVTVYRNAAVWNGAGFSPRTLYVGGERFLAGVPAGAITTDVDLAGKFVVPALGSAHEHSINPNPTNDWAYFSDGVYYLWNANSIVTGRNARDYYRRRDTVDVATAMGGITEPGGHPEVLYTDVLTKYVYKGVDPASFLNNAYHYGRNRREITEALDRLVAHGADFVKAMLLESENYATRKTDPKARGARGLNPQLIPYLVAQANKRGLWTYVHVETAADLVTAARAGAKVSGHLPAYNDADRTELAKMRLSPAQARIVARSGIMLVPTYSVARSRYAALEKDGKLDRASQQAVYAVQGANMRALHRAGAVFLTGTDISTPVAEEAIHWVEIGGMSRRDALRATLATGQRMFPDRRIGCFEAGCEADFLVLTRNPTEDLRALQSIEQRVKGGLPLVRPPATDKTAN